MPNWCIQSWLFSLAILTYFPWRFLPILTYFPWRTWSEEPGINDGEALKGGHQLETLARRERNSFRGLARACCELSARWG
jgi:hypothetical protein